jgi:hypothetical protein
MLVKSLFRSMLAFVILVVASHSFADAFSGLNHQGLLLDQTGHPVNATTNLILRVWRQPTSTAPADLLYQETQNAVSVVDGVYSVTLGAGTSPSGPFNASLFSLADTWLEVVVNGETMAPRQKLLAVAYALQCVNATTLNGLAASAYTQHGSISDADISSTAAIAGTKTDANFGALNLRTNGWIGTDLNQPLEIHVNGQRVLRIEPTSGSPNLIGGASTNGVLPGFQGATIAGGGDGAGNPNQVQSSFGSIGGGTGNAANYFGVVAGGNGNYAGGWYSVVAGGQTNYAFANYSAIAGGGGNQVNGNDSFVGGGTANQSSGLGGAVVGGNGNQATGEESCIGGGSVNLASGSNSVVPGGASNVAGGASSFAAGYHAHVRSAADLFLPAGHDGTFVWADRSAPVDFLSTGQNQFLARATGGFGFNTNATAANQFIVISTGGVGFNAASAPAASQFLVGASGGFGLNATSLSGGDLQIGNSSDSSAFRLGSAAARHRMISNRDFQFDAFGTTGPPASTLFSFRRDATKFDDSSATTVMSVSAAGDLTILGSGFKPGGGSWSVSSDVRLKKNIHPLDRALESLLDLHGITFEYKDPDAIHELHGERIGFTAQNVEKVFPDWVSEGADGYKRVTVRGFEALTVEALRELETRETAESAEIQKLRAENRELHDENRALQARFDHLESALGLRAQN